MRVCDSGSLCCASYHRSVHLRHNWKRPRKPSSFLTRRLTFWTSTELRRKPFAIRILWARTSSSSSRAPKTPKNWSLSLNPPRKTYLNERNSSSRITALPKTTPTVGRLRLRMCEVRNRLCRNWATPSQRRPTKRTLLQEASSSNRRPAETHTTKSWITYLARAIWRTSSRYSKSQIYN